MRRDDERGQAIQIGAVLLFGVLVIALAGYQAFVVPQQNERVEFSHSQTVQNQLQDLRNAVVSTVGGGSTRSVSVRLGTRYPARLVAVNPGPPTGTLRTAGTDESAVAFAVENAMAGGETGDFWTGSNPRTYPTGGIVYRPNYNVYGGAPTTVYENTVLFNRFPSGTTALAGQALVAGNRITLVALDGSLSTTRSSAVSVDVRPVSTSTRTVSVTDSGSPITLRIPTRLSTATWEELLDGQFTDQGGHVLRDRLRTEPLGAPGLQTLVVELEAGERYALRMAKVGVGTDVSETSETYLTDVSGDGATVEEGASRLVTVEVRDSFNNPVSGVTVSADVDSAGGTLVDPDDGDDAVTTGADGRATFRYTAGANAGGSDYALRFSFDDATPSGFTESDPEDVGMTISVAESASGPSSGGSAPYTVSWRSPTTDSDYTHDVQASGDTVDLEAVVRDATAQGKETVEGAAVDFAVNDTSVATLSATEVTSAADGTAETTLTAQSAGTVRVYVVSGGASDVINVTFENVPQTPEIEMRVDDFTDRNGNSPVLAASYDVSNAGPSFERVRISFTASDGSPSDTLRSTDSRGHLTFEPGYGQNEQFDVTAEVVATDAQGDEYVADSVTITDTADARNPTDQNADLSTTGTASLDSWTVEDDTNVNGNKVRYRFDYAVGSGSYGKVRLFVLNLNGDGATGTVDRTAESGSNVKVQPGFGANKQYRVGIAVFDGEGAIVQVVDAVDSADGGGQVTLTATALLLAGLGITGIRRRSGSR